MTSFFAPTVATDDGSTLSFSRVYPCGQYTGLPRTAAFSSANTSRASQEIQRIVVQADNHWSLLALVHARGPQDFDARNISTCIHRIARHWSQSGSSDSIWSDVRSRTLLDTMSAQCAQLTAWGVSDAMWGLAKLKCGDKDVLMKVMDRAVEVVADFDAQGLAISAWALATLGWIREDWLERCKPYLLERLPSFQPQNLANYVWAMATLQYRDDSVLGPVLEQTIGCLGAFKAQELANLMWAVAKIGLREDDVCVTEWYKKFRDAAMTRDNFSPPEISQIAHGIASMKIYDAYFFRFLMCGATNSMRHFGGQNLATMLWAVATVSFKDDPGVDDFLRAALGAVVGRSHEFSPVNLALISWAFAKLSYKAEAMFAALAQAVLAKINSFAPQNIVQVTWAMASIGHRDEGLLAAVAGHCINLDLTPQHLANLLWAFARFGYRDVEFLNSLYERCVHSVPEFTPQQLANVAWGVSTFGDSASGTALLQTIEQQCALQMDGFHNTALIMLSDSLFEAHKNGYPYNEAYHRIIHSRIGGLFNDLVDLFRGVPGAEWTRQEAFEYQQRLKAVGLMTLGYEYSTSLLEKLHLSEVKTEIPDWQPNAGRTSCSSVWDIDVGGTPIRGNEIFVSGFVLPGSDVEGPFVAGGLGGGKGDLLSAAKHGRSGDSECRALVDIHRQIQELQEVSPELVHVCGTIALHVSGVPCLSCVGVMAQFKSRHPKVSLGVSFELREQNVDSPEFRESGSEDVPSHGADKRHRNTLHSRPLNDDRATGQIPARQTTVSSPLPSEPTHHRPAAHRDIMSADLRWTTYVPSTSLPKPDLQGTTHVPSTSHHESDLQGATRGKTEDACHVGNENLRRPRRAGEARQVANGKFTYY